MQSSVFRPDIQLWRQDSDPEENGVNVHARFIVYGLYALVIDPISIGTVHRALLLVHFARAEAYFAIGEKTHIRFWTNAVKLLGAIAAQPKNALTVVPPAGMICEMLLVVAAYMM